jgi:hypothetical protein
MLEITDMVINHKTSRMVMPFDIINSLTNQPLAK